MEAFHQASSLMMGNEVTTIIFFLVVLITNRAAGGEKSDPNIVSICTTRHKGAFEMLANPCAPIMADDLENSIKLGEAIYTTTGDAKCIGKTGT